MESYDVWSFVSGFFHLMFSRFVHVCHMHQYFIIIIIFLLSDISLYKSCFDFKI